MKSAADKIATELHEKNTECVRYKQKKKEYKKEETRKK